MFQHQRQENQDLFLRLLPEDDGRDAQKEVFRFDVLVSALSSPLCIFSDLRSVGVSQVVCGSALDSVGQENWILDADLFGSSQDHRSNLVPTAYT